MIADLQAAEFETRELRATRCRPCRGFKQADLHRGNLAPRHLWRSGQEPKRGEQQFVRISQWPHRQGSWSAAGNLPSRYKAMASSGVHLSPRTQG